MFHKKIYIYLKSTFFNNIDQPHHLTILDSHFTNIGTTSETNVETNGEQRNIDTKQGTNVEFTYGPFSAQM